jgi:hypothetical protein
MQIVLISFYIVLVCNIIQWMTFDEVNTRIDQSLYSPKLKVINCFLI